MALITRQQLDSVKLRTQLVDVPEWRTPTMGIDEMPQVLVRELMGNERDDYEASLLTMRGAGKKMQQELHLKNARAKLAQKGMINEDGTPLYRNTPGDISAIGSLPAKGLERVCDAIMELSGINADDEEELTGAAANFPNGETNGFGTS